MAGFFNILHRFELQASDFNSSYEGLDLVTKANLENSKQ